MAAGVVLAESVGSSAMADCAALLVPAFVPV